MQVADPLAAGASRTLEKKPQASQKNPQTPVLMLTAKTESFFKYILGRKKKNGGESVRRRPFVV
ncbi:MAG: hypothetical protein ACOY30_01095 [Bacillota bacterium]